MESTDYLRYVSKDIVGYTKAVGLVLWNTEGKYFAVASKDNNVRIGQLELSGATKNVHTIPSNSEVDGVCWNPAQDNRLAIYGTDKTVDLWDVRASRANMKIPTQGNNIFCSWSKCGNYIASVNKSNLISVLDVREGRTVKKKKFPYQVNNVAWSANSEYFLSSTGGEELGGIDVISVMDDLNVVDSVSAHSGGCTSLQVDPSFSRMASGSMDFTCSVWDLDSLVCKHVKSMESNIQGLTFSGSGEQIALYSDDLFILVFDSDSGRDLCKVPVRDTVNSVAWHPTLPLLAVGLHVSKVNQYLQFISFLQNT